MKSAVKLTILKVGRLILPLKVRLLLGPLTRTLFPELINDPKVFDEYKQEEHQKIYRYWLKHCEPDILPSENHSATADFALVVNAESFSCEQLNEFLRSLSEPMDIALQILLISHQGAQQQSYPESVTWLTPAALNQALGTLSCQYVLTVTQPCQFRPGAMQMLQKALAETNNQLKLLYFDHDYLSQNNQRTLPQCKPEWNPDYFCSYNYIGGLVLTGKSIVQSLHASVTGPMTTKQLYAKLLEQTASMQPLEIAHIPHILAHLYQATGPVKDPTDEDETILSALTKRHPGTEISQNKTDHLQRIKWPLPTALPLVSIIIPAHNACTLTKTCIDSILQKTRYPNYEIILVDNRSDEPLMLAYIEALKANPKISVIHDSRPFNYSQINNDAVKQAKGDIILFANNDIEVINPEWLDEMVAQALRPEIGCVGAKLYYTNDLIQHAGVIIGYGEVAGHAHKFFPGKHPGYMNRLMTVQNVSAVTAACLAIERRLFEQSGGFDEVNLTVAFNDVDLCLKIQQMGLRNLWTPYAELYHHESVSRGEDHSPEKRARFEKEIAYMKQRWHTDNARDPAYNPNLAINREDFAMRV